MKQTIPTSRKLVVLFAASTLIAVPLTRSPAMADDESTPNVSPAIVAATKHAAEFDVKLVEAGDREQPKVSDHPLLMYGDAARDNEAGTLWAWANGGRPVAMMELFRETGSAKPWVHAVTLTSPRLVRMTSTTGASWRPQSSDFELHDLGGDTSVGDTPAARLRQMKDHARRFTAHEFWDPNNSRFELRLLTQPVYRYSDLANKLLDGTCFVLAHGTNPEILLFIEATGDAAATAKWQFGFARLGSAELHVELDNAEVWRRGRVPGVTGLPTDSFWLFFSQRQKD